MKVLLVGLVLFLTSTLSFANDAYPSKPIKIYTNVSAGGTIDLTARLLAEQLQRTLNTPVVVMNMPGGHGTIASNFVKNAQPDGYTLYLMSPAHVTSPFVMETQYHPYNDFTFIGPLIRSPMALLTTSNSLKSFNEIKNVEQDEKLTYIASNSGSGPHLAMMALELKLGKKFLFIPHKGAGPSLADFLGNRVDFGMYVLPTALSIIGGNSQVSAIAVSGDKRIPLLPDTPTFKELGIKDLSIDTYYGLIAPANVPEHIVKNLNSTVNNIFNDSSFIKKLNDQGLFPQQMSSSEFRKFVVKQVDSSTEVLNYYKERVK